MKSKFYYISLISLLLIGCYEEYPALPPDPGEAGKVTLEGVDSDNDGVRDDIQRYIAINYPESINANKALTGLAKVYQDFIINSNNEIYIKKQWVHLANNVVCLYELSPSTASKDVTKFKSIVLNTEQRVRAYVRSDAYFSGSNLSLPEEGVCFDKLGVE